MKNKFKKKYNFWKGFSKKKKFFWIFMIILGILFLVGIYHSFKPLPKGTSFEGPVREVNQEDIFFVRDLTYNSDNFSRLNREHEIFNKIFEMIDNSKEFILIDMFLMGNSRDGYRNLSLELSQRLIKKKQENSEIVINFITDEFNTRYWSFETPEIMSMRNAGINIIYTDMTKMRDSNIIYSVFWRSFFQWFGRPNFNCQNSLFKIKGEGVCVRSFLRMANAKANHRKIVLADYKGERYNALITSANPDDGGSGYSNVGVYFSKAGKLAQDIYFSEKSVADFSYGNFTEYNLEISEKEIPDKDVAEVQILTEGKIKKEILKEIRNTINGETIDITMFLLTEQEVIDALANAAKRGVEINLILDKSNDLFERDSKGVPNCPAAKDLMKKSNGNINIRWYNTGDQQFHSKMMIISKSNGRTIVIIGSANYTKRNIKNFNLEVVVKINVDSSSQFVSDINDYFKLIWENKNKKEGIYTQDYNKNTCGFLRGIQYKIQEWTGFSTF